jgi:glycosyltransferase involved in cell wall biosynthesis
LENDLVSVIIPTYRRSDRLKISILSALNQSYKNIEVLVVDDNNPNTPERKATEAIMEKIESSKVKYIKHRKNSNGAVARNTGIKNSCGTYIAFLDDDDTFLPDKIRKQVEFLKCNNNYNAVSCGVYKNGIKKMQNCKSNNLILDILLMNFLPMTPTLMFRRQSLESINSFDESYVRHQDIEMMIRFLKNNKLGYIYEPLVEIGNNDGENIPTGEKLEELKNTFLDKFTNEASMQGNMNKNNLKRIYCKHYVEVFYNHLKNKNYKLLFNVLKRYFIKYPFSFTKYAIKYLINYIYNKFKRMWLKLNLNI